MDGIMNYVHSPEEDFYAILGCSENSQAEQILTEYKVRALNLHPDKHPDDPDAVAKFQRLQEAKNTLSEPEKRKKYDKWRLSGLAMSYQQWQSYHNRVHTNMHWANPPPLANMLNPPEISSESETIASTQASKSRPFKIIWTGSTNNEIVRKFRNYEI